MSLFADPAAGLPLFVSAGPEEQAKARTALDRMAEERRVWLELVRSRLVALYLSRVATTGEERAHVTADDARRLMEAEPSRYALPAGASTNLLGSLFRSAEWELIDREHVSSTEGSHGNILARWRWVGRRPAA